MGVHSLCALCLTIAGLALSSLTGPEQEGTGQSADLPNVKNLKDVTLQQHEQQEQQQQQQQQQRQQHEQQRQQQQQQLLIMGLLAELEDRFERRETEWRTELRGVRAVLRRLEDDNQRLQALVKQKTCQESTPKHPYAQHDKEAKPSQKKPENGTASLQQQPQQQEQHQQQKQQPERTESPQQQRQPSLVTRSDDTSSLEPVVNELSRRVGEVGAEVEALKNANAQQDLRIQQAATTTYVRWGRSVCPPSAELVYAGAVGGADYRGQGASTSVLCLPLDPVSNGGVVKPQYYAELWGAEYQTHGSNPAHNNMDPVCAVCRAARATSVMVPARNVCQDGWVLEYSGYLMGSYPAHPGGHQFLCMDSALEDRQGSEADQEGLLMYMTFARCHGSSLPCPPYQQDQVVTCAMCSK